MEKPTNSPANVGQWAARALQGALIGGGAILPGISGGVLCVVFGLYRPMMALLADPIRCFGQYWRMFLPVGIGWIAGFFGFARLVEMAFALSANAAVCLFIGLIAGTFPSLWREAGKEGRSRSGAAAAVLSFAALLGALLFFGSAGEELSLTPNVGWFFFCGILWGLSLIIPGMTSSSVLIFLGLFQPMNSGIASFDMSVVVPMALGVAATVLVLARAVDRLFRERYTVAFHIVLGVTAASTAVIIPTSFAGAGEALTCALLFIAGCFAAGWIEKLGKAPRQERS